MTILFSKLAYSAYIIPYLHRLYNNLFSVLSSDLFAALSSPILSADPSGLGSKDIKIKPIVK